MAGNVFIPRIGRAAEMHPLCPNPRSLHECLKDVYRAALGGSTLRPRHELRGEVECHARDHWRNCSTIDYETWQKRYGALYAAETITSRLVKSRAPKAGMYSSATISSIRDALVETAPSAHQGIKIHKIQEEVEKEIADRQVKSHAAYDASRPRMKAMSEAKAGATMARETMRSDERRRWGEGMAVVCGVLDRLERTPPKTRFDWSRLAGVVEAAAFRAGERHSSDERSIHAFAQALHPPQVGLPDLSQTRSIAKVRGLLVAEIYGDEAIHHIHEILASSMKKLPLSRRAEDVVC